MSPIEHFLQSWSIPILTLALIFITGYYAHKTKEMVKETKRLVEITHNAYLVTLTPELEFMKTMTSGSQGNLAWFFSVKNVGRYPITWSLISTYFVPTTQLGTRNDISQLVDKKILPKGTHSVRVEWPSNREVEDHVAEIIDSAEVKHQYSLRGTRERIWS